MMTDQIPEFKEEYWEDALLVLKREERKLLYRKLRRAAVFLLIPIGIAMLVMLQVQPSGKMLSSLEEQKAELRKSASEEADSMTNEVSEDSASGTTARQSGNAAQTSFTSETENNLDQPQSTGQFSIPTPVSAVSPMVEAVAESSSFPGQDNRIDQQRNESIVVAPKPENSHTQSDPLIPFNPVKIDPVSDGLSNPIVSYPSMSMFRPSALPYRSVYSPRDPDLRLFSTSIPNSANKNRVTKLSPRLDHFYLGLGNSFLTGYGSARNPVNLQLEAGYEKQLSHKWALSAGLSYFQVGGIRHRYDADITQLSFGAETTRISIITNKLMYLSLPVSLNYHIDIRHSLFAGLRMSYLLNASSTIKEGNINTSEDTWESSTSYGYTAGYNRLQFTPAIGYSFRMSNKFKASMWYEPGLGNVSNGTYYPVNDNDRNQRLMLQLNYQLRP